METKLILKIITVIHRGLDLAELFLKVIATNDTKIFIKDDDQKFK